jgi:hypothetical protein
MYNYIFIGAVLWRYYHVIEYGYSGLCYANSARHFIFDKKPEPIYNNEDWVLVDKEIFEDEADIGVVVGY